MAFSADQLAALESAAASGHLTVQLGDRRIQYQSLGDLLRAIEVAKRDVQTAAGAGLPRRHYLAFSRGD